MFLETKKFYDAYDAGAVGTSYAYGRLGSPSGHPVNGRNFVDTTGNVTQIDAVDGTPFDPIVVGDTIIFFAPRPDGKIVRKVATKTSAIDIDVDAAVDLSSPVGGFAFMFYPFRSGTTDDDGWHSVNHLSALTVHYNLTALVSTSVELQAEGGGGGDFTAPTAIAAEVSVSAVGAGSFNIDKVTPSLRVGLKATGAGAGDAISVWVTGEMLQA